MNTEVVSEKAIGALGVLPVSAHVSGRRPDGPSREQRTLMGHESSSGRLKYSAGLQPSQKGTPCSKLIEHPSHLSQRLSSPLALYLSCVYKSLK
jgi:hypothetical protein